VAAGWPVVRTFRATADRRGLVRPTWRQVVAAVVLAPLLVIASGLITYAINWVWTSLGWPTTDLTTFNKLMSGVMTPAGALVVGVVAGVGEEMAVRGLLQPRFGLIASNLVFTSLHAFQYGLDALLGVFIVGLILGIIRARSNTTTSIIVHGLYDFISIIAGT
jgi:membrane protease YdiL (CAAX protease family)